ncbi:MAG: adenylate/guanylate cyclase domain-containing protein [Planctomycetota bacterium]
MKNDNINRLFLQEEKAGEQKVNILRLAALAIFFADELFNYYVLGVVEARLHFRGVWLIAGWGLFAAAAWYWINRRGSYARWMKYVSSGTDALLLTWVIIALEGNSGPLLSLYYILIVNSALRYSRSAILAAAGFCAAGYGAVWYSSFGNPNIPPVSLYVAILHLISMIVAGVFVGYVVKKMRGLVQEFADNLVRRELAENALRRYVSRQVAQQILDSPDIGETMRAGRRTHVAILISDIRSFTPMAESMKPEALLELLNGYFRRMVDIVFKYDGTLDKFVGDALIVVFNDPFEQPDAEKRAVMCAAEMQREIARFNSEQEAAGKKTLGVGIGVHCGTVVAGNVGSESRMDYTVMGQVVNFASRLQGKAPAGAIHVSTAVFAKTAREFAYNSLGPVEFKGYSGSSEIFELEQ